MRPFSLDAGERWDADGEGRHPVQEAFNYYVTTSGNQVGLYEKAGDTQQIKQKRVEACVWGG